MKAGGKKERMKKKGKKVINKLLEFEGRKYEFYMIQIHTKGFPFLRQCRHHK